MAAQIALAAMIVAAAALLAGAAARQPPDAAIPSGLACVPCHVGP